MKQILAIAGSMVLALILMDTYQVVKAPSGLGVVKAGQALAADMGPPPPPPVAAPIGKGKAPIGKGKGKAPIAPPIVTKGFRSCQVYRSPAPRWSRNAAEIERSS